MNSSIENQKEATAQFLWTVFILLFFVIQAVIWSIAITITANDSSHAVVAGYEEQALNWDEVKQQREKSAALGWKADIRIGEPIDILGNRQITIDLKDKEHYPIENALVSLQIFHRAQAANVHQVELKSDQSGLYHGKLPMNRSGKWRITGVAAMGSKQLLIDQTIQLSPKKGE